MFRYHHGTLPTTTFAQGCLYLSMRNPLPRPTVVHSPTLILLIGNVVVAHMKSYPDTPYFIYLSRPFFFFSSFFELYNTFPVLCFPPSPCSPCQVHGLSFAAVKHRSLCSHRPHSVHSFLGKSCRQGLRAFCEYSSIHPSYELSGCQRDLQPLSDSRSIRTDQVSPPPHDTFD
ncbi:hypothetical protein F5B17DRAFT_341499 [Nemania serpens]|nr:hypothetical protein F5B17DRAFT_341499 [Nemania serpens]